MGSGPRGGDGRSHRTTKTKPFSARPNFKIIGIAFLFTLSSILLFAAGRSSAIATKVETAGVSEKTAAVSADPFIPFILPQTPFMEPDFAAFVDTFVADCEKGINSWKDGYVDYPSRLAVDLGESEAYVVAVNIRDAPPPANRVFSGVDPDRAPIAVQCAIGARLVPVGDAVEVDEEEWVFREFTPSGIVNWAWSVKALKPTGQTLRLELQPVVTLQGGYGFLGGGGTNTTATFVTEVDIHASWFQRVGEWWNDNSEVIVLLAGGIGVTLLAVVNWGGDFGQALRDAAAKWRGRREDDQAQQREVQASAAARPARPPANRKKRR